ncbi:hypothetical protein CR513_14197, partial [Mucuna pruriens]
MQKDEAEWRRGTKERMVVLETFMNWENFKTIFLEKYFPYNARCQKESSSYNSNRETHWLVNMWSSLKIWLSFLSTFKITLMKNGRPTIAQGQPRSFFSRTLCFQYSLRKSKLQERKDYLSYPQPPSTLIAENQGIWRLLKPIKGLKTKRRGEKILGAKIERRKRGEFLSGDSEKKSTKILRRIEGKTEALRKEREVEANDSTKEAAPRYQAETEERKEVLGRSQKTADSSDISPFALLPVLGLNPSRSPNRERNSPTSKRKPIQSILSSHCFCQAKYTPTLLARVRKPPREPLVLTTTIVIISVATTVPPKPSTERPSLYRRHVVTHRPKPTPPSAESVSVLIRLSWYKPALLWPETLLAKTM